MGVYSAAPILIKMGNKLRLVFISIWIGWAIVIVFNLLNYSEDNPIKIQYNLFGEKLKTFFPEGWAFFTRNAKEDYLDAYKFSDGHLYIIPGQRQAEIPNLFGLKRDSRAISVEYAYLLSKIKSENTDSLWTECYFSDVDSLIRINKIKSYNVMNFTNDPFLVDTVFIISQRTVPWAWSKNADKIKFPIKIVGLDIKNSK